MDEKFQDLQDSIMLEYEAGWERTQALTRFYEAYCWIQQCTKKSTEPLTDRVQAIKSAISPWDGTGVLVSMDEFIKILEDNKFWQIMPASSGALVLYVKGEKNQKDRIYFGPNPNDLDPGVAFTWMENVRRLQRARGQVTTR